MPAPGPAGPKPAGKKLGGLPAWAWVLAIGGGLVVGFVLLKGKGGGGAGAGGDDEQGSGSGAGKEGGGATVVSPLDSDTQQALGLGGHDTGGGQHGDGAGDGSGSESAAATAEYGTSLAPTGQTPTGSLYQVPAGTAPPSTQQAAQAAAGVFFGSGSTQSTPTVASPTGKGVVE